MHSILTIKTLLLGLVIFMLMGYPSRIILQSLNISGHMLLDCLLNLIFVLPALVPAILVLLLRFLPTLVMTTTVRLVTICKVQNLVSFRMIPCGMGSSVMVHEEAPCCIHPNIPWFTKTLGETTTEDIQLRLCVSRENADEETLLQLISLYVY